MTAGGLCNLGFIGCGRLMTRQHIQNAHKSNVCTIRTLCDIDEDTLSATAERFPPEKTTADYTDILADPQIDAVVIAMNHRLHCRFTLEALSAGKHVYVEKPLGETVDDALEVARKAHDTGLHVAVGLNRRFAPAYRDLLPHIRARKESCLAYYRIADPFEGPGDRLHVEICHVFDALRWLLDSDPVEVWAAIGHYKYDSIVNLKFPDGSITTILASSQGNEMLPKEHIEAMWDDKAVTIEDFTEARYFFDDSDVPPVRRYRGLAYEGCPSDYVERFVTEGIEVLYEERRKKHVAELLAAGGGKADEGLLRRPFNYIVSKGWREALDGFALAVLAEGEFTNADARDAAWATLLADAANESAATGRPVPINAEKLRL